MNPRLAPLVLVLPLTASSPPPGSDGGPDPRPLIFHAVLEGLYADGVANDVVDAVTALDPDVGWPLHFVYACPICMPAFDAFRLYRARSAFLGDKQQRDTFGSGLAPEVRAALLGSDPYARQTALRTLIAGWVGRRLRSMALDEGDRLGLRIGFEESRKKGLALLAAYRRQGLHLYDHLQGCAFCDGANDAAMGL